MDDDDNVTFDDFGGDDDDIDEVSNITHSIFVKSFCWFVKPFLWSKLKRKKLEFYANQMKL